MYLYSGIDIVRHPNAWTWAVRSLPIFISESINKFGVEKFLYIQGISEIIFAVLLLGWFMPKKIIKYIGLFSAIEMAAIALLVGVDAITFRDIGLICPGLALFLML